MLNNPLARNRHDIIFGNKLFCNSNVWHFAMTGYSWHINQVMTGKTEVCDPQHEAPGAPEGNFCTFLIIPLFFAS